MFFPCNLCAQVSSHENVVEILSNPLLKEKVQKYLPCIDLKSKSSLQPKLMCSVCKEIVDQWNLFYLKCAHAQRTLHMTQFDTLIEKKKKKRKTYCFAKFCANTDLDEKMFHLPKDLPRAKQWLMNASRTDLLTPDVTVETLYRKGLTLCAVHFERRMFSNELRRSLVADAMPSLFSSGKRSREEKVEIETKGRKICPNDRVKTHGSSHTGSTKNSTFDMVTDSNTTRNPSAQVGTSLYPLFDTLIDIGLSVGNKSTDVESSMTDSKKAPKYSPLISRLNVPLTVEPDDIEISKIIGSTNDSPPSKSSKTALKESSNVPLNVMKVVYMRSSDDPKSPPTSHLRQIESKMSSVSVVISRATRNASDPFRTSKSVSEKNYVQVTNVDEREEGNGRKNVSNLDIDFDENTNLQESPGRKKVAKENVTARGKLSSKHKASDLVDKNTVCIEPNVGCVEPRIFNLSNENSPVELNARKRLLSNTMASHNVALQLEHFAPNYSKDISDELDSIRDTIPNVTNDGKKFTTEVPEPIRNSHLPPGILHHESVDRSKSISLSADSVSPASNKISNPLNSYETFQEKVNQIRDILKELESNDGSNLEEDYDDYDSEDIPAQFKYLSLFEEKYGRGRNGKSMSSFYHTPEISFNITRDDMSIPPGMIVDYPEENRVMKLSLNDNPNAVPVKEIIPLSQIEDIEGTDVMVHHGVNNFNKSDTNYYPEIQARNFTKNTPIWMMSNVSSKRMPPTPFSKSNTGVSNRGMIILNDKEDKKNSSSQNKEEQKTISAGQSVRRLSPLRSANEKLIKAVESLFKQASTDLAQIKKHPSHISDHNHQYDPSTVSESNNIEVSRYMYQFNENHTPSSAEYTNNKSDHRSSNFVKTDPLETLSNEQSLGQHFQEELKADQISPDELAQPVNTFLYEYEDISLPENPDDPVVNRTPLFLDTGETGSQIETVEDRRRNKFEHFSSNDIDSVRFTASVSSAQVRLYELYRDQQLSTAQTLELESTNTSSDVPSAAAMSLLTFQYQESRCFTGSKEGLCFTNEICRKKGGQIGSNCNFQGLYCCTFTYTCGDMTKERVTYFKSPQHPARPSSGLTCDYDVTIRSDVCAVRIEFEKVNLARKLGGVCDIDQLFILNSIDGPTTGQCGPLSGYATTVAVTGSQVKPLKIALLIQSAAPFYWYIKVIQLSCSHVKNFRVPFQCGRTSTPRSLDPHPVQFPQRKWHRVPRRRHNRAQDKKKIWWKYPEPILNTFYFSATKRHLQALHHARQPRRRIVSGSEAEIGEFPWQVAIALDGMFFCGGALLNEHFVLTAAHCIMTRDTPVSDLVLHLGDHDLLHLNETAHVRRGVRRILFHSHFHPFVLSNDIALLQLDRPVVFSHTIQPVCLPQRGESFIGKRGTVVGWGVTSFPMGEPSPTLQKLEVKVLSNARCATVIEEPIGIGMLCAAPDETQGTCFGDSGGPLTFAHDSGYHVLAGIVSYGVTGCAIIPAYPDLYTRVSEYLRWINVNAIVTK